MSPDAAAASLFVTLPAAVVLVTLSLWAYLLLWGTPSYVALPVGRHGGIVDVPVQGRLMASWHVQTISKADHFLLFDLADPPPPQGETYTLDLAAPACAGDVQQVLFLDRRSSLSFNSIVAKTPGMGTIRVVWQRREVCRLTDLARPPLRCHAQGDGFHRIVYSHLSSVDVRVTGARFVARNALCGNACDRQVRAAWRTVTHPILLLPRDPICSNSSHQADPFPEQVARVELIRPWGTIFLLGFAVQLAFQSTVALAVFLCTRGRRSKGPPLQCTVPHDYQTFSVTSDVPALPVMFPEGSVKYLLVFIMSGWLGLHRMHRITQHHPADRTTVLLAFVACLILGPVFFAQDGFCFADFLQEEDVSLLGPDPEVLGRLELRLILPTGVAIAEQPARHFSYMVFLLPYYWVIVTRLTELLHCVDMFSQVTSALLWASAALLAMWLLCPMSIIIASRSHDVILVVRQWFCFLQVWGIRRSVFLDLDGRLDWSTNVIRLKLRGVHPDRLLHRRLHVYWAPAAVLHFLPLVPRLLPAAPPPVDLFPAGPKRPPGGRLPILPWDGWMAVAQFLDLRSAAWLAATSQAFSGLFDHDAFWRQRLPARAAERWAGVAPKTQVFLLQMARREQFQEGPVVATGIVPFPTTTSVWHLQPICDG